jgi:hypothetical protein
MHAYKSAQYTCIIPPQVYVRFGIDLYPSSLKYALANPYPIAYVYYGRPLTELSLPVVERY